ncbi:hypothetical protein [Solidesulfovibrio sp.]
MTRAQLTLALRVLRGFGASKTTYALLGLYALGCGLAWLVSQGIIQPDGTVDLRLWANGRILEIPTFSAWKWGAGVAALPLGFGFYARGVAKGPLFPAIQTAAPDLAAMVQARFGAPACEPQAEPDRPSPVVLQPAGIVAAATLGSLGAGSLKPTGVDQ